VGVGKLVAVEGLSYSRASAAVRAASESVNR